MRLIIVAKEDEAMARRLRHKLAQSGGHETVQLATTVAGLIGLLNHSKCDAIIVVSADRYTVQTFVNSEQMQSLLTAIDVIGLPQLDNEPLSEPGAADG